MSDKAIPPGSLVLVTGVNGYIASHIADQLLSLGYRVRGTARGKEKLDPMAETFRRRHPSAFFEGVVVGDFAEEEGLDKVVAGCSGIIHTASDVSFNPDPYKVVPQVVQGTLNLLDAASKESSITRFVYTSSLIAAVHPTPNKRFHTDSTSWNDGDVKDAWAPAPYEPSRAFAVYAASKVEAERACWDFVKTKCPRFTLNAVLPNFAVGPRLDLSQHGSTSGWVRGLYEGDPQLTERMRTFPPQYSVDVRDIARAHVQALLETDVQGKRLFAFAEPYNYSRIVKILKAYDPSRNEYPPPPEDEGQDLSTVDHARVVELLKRSGARGFITLEQSLREQLDNE